MMMMISVQEAYSLLQKHTLVLGSRTIGLAESQFCVLAEDVISPIDHPLFDMTAVDGYAFRFQDLNEFETLNLSAEMKAGDKNEVQCNAGEAVRIFTGAEIPTGTDTVVMQEFCSLTNGILQINDPGLKLGGNIRKKAEQICKGDRALPKGHRMDTASIGFLASLGIREINVFTKPKVGLIITGNEFAESTEDLSSGKIFESNGVMLQAALRQTGINSSYETCIDDKILLTEKIGALASKSDVIMLTGGVSVGDYDFTKPALEANGFEIIFHKINQQPGKPFLFAKKGNCVAFGLPGNPRSVLSCFYVYALPFLHRMMQDKKPGLLLTKLALSEPVKKKEGRAQFLTGVISGNEISIASSQGSHMLQSFALADAIIFLPQDPGYFEKGELVEVLLLPK